MRSDKNTTRPEMRTEDLIGTLAASQPPGGDPKGRLCVALAPALGVAVLAVWALWGIRPDLTAALTAPTLLKTVGPAAVATPALALALRRAMPARNADGPGLSLAGLFVLAGLLLLWTLTDQGPAALPQALIDGRTVVALVSIPLLGLLPLVAALWALRAGAPTAPAWAGAQAGLGAGGLGAAVYSLSCTDDAALFVLPAYGAGIALVALAGALLGTRVLRW